MANLSPLALLAGLFIGLIKGVSDPYFSVLWCEMPVSAELF